MSDNAATFLLCLGLCGLAFLLGFAVGADDMRDECLDALSQAEMRCFDTDHCILGESGKWVRTANGWKKGMQP